MKLLLFSDIHTSRKHCERLAELAREADMVIGAGDFGSLRRGIKKTINWLSAIDKPAILVPGNAESEKELKEACKNWPSAIVLHGNGTQVHGIHFYGIGGGIPVTPFGAWSYDFSEQQAEELLKDCPEKAVLVSHSPPKGFLDRSSRGDHLGSETILKVIRERAPRLVVCGHIHESGGKKDKIDDAVVINAGPEGMFYELDP